MFLKLLNKRKNILIASIFVLVFLISFLLRFLIVLNYNFPFTMDQGRDMLDIRNVVDGLNPTLIGPTTSINGVYLGPFWYYFNIPPYLLGQGNPSALVYWMLGWYMLAGFLFYFLYRKKDPILGLIISIIFLMAPNLYFPSRYSWSANPMPYMLTFYFLALIRSLDKKDFFSFFIVGLISGLSMQIEAAFGVLLAPFALFFYTFKRIRFINTLSAFFGFFITLLPQILFELRHKFIMTNTFISEVTGKSAILGKRLTFMERPISHLKTFSEVLYGIFKVDSTLILLIFLSAIIFLSFMLIKNKLDKLPRNYFLAVTFFIIFAYIFYLFYPYPIKGWYILGLYVPFIIIFGVFFTEILKLKKIYLSIFVIGFLGLSFYHTIIHQLTFVPKSINERSTDKSNFRNEVEVVDWVYKEANGRAFKAYNYIPSVYDFPYQYIYWWHGTREYGYQPDTLTYLDNVPEYIINNESFLTKKKKTSDSDPIFLIIETDEYPDRRAAWLGSFVKYCLEKSHTFPWKTAVQVRKVCDK